MSDYGPILLTLMVQISLPLLGGILLSYRRAPGQSCALLYGACWGVLILSAVAFVPRIDWSSTPSSTAQLSPRSSVDLTEPGLNSPGQGISIDLLTLLNLVDHEAVADSPSTLDAWYWLTVGLVGVGLLGMIRLLCAWFSTQKIIARCQPLLNQDLVALFAQVRQELGETRAITLLQTSLLGGAATAGWFRPCVLLSTDWVNWTPEQLRAVLAHEIAHVKRGDYARRFVSRLSLALHGYHPLLRWLVRRLELQQEMAADALASLACGGRVAYGKALASLALRLDAAAESPESPTSPTVLSPTFFSDPKTLFRRLAMLRVTEDTHRRRWPSLLVLAGLTAVGFIFDGAKTQAEPVVPAAFAESSRTPLDLRYIVASNEEGQLGMIAVHLGELFSKPGMEKITDIYGKALKMLAGNDGKKIRFDFKDIDQVAGRFVITIDEKAPQPNRAFMCSLNAVHMYRDFDWVGQLKDMCKDLKEHKHAGTSYYEGKFLIPLFGPVEKPIWFYIPDAKTLVIEDEATIKKLIDRKGKPAAAMPWATEWSTVEKGLVGCIITDPKKMAKKIAPPADTKDATEGANAQLLADFFTKTDLGAIGIDLGEGVDLSLRFKSASKEEAKALEGMSKQFLALGKTQVDKPDEIKTEFDKLGQKMLKTLVESTSIGIEGETNVQIRLNTKSGLTELLKAMSLDGK